MRRPFISILAVAGLALSTHAAVPRRCDLVSQSSPSKCLDLTKLDGSILQVPLSTTRIPSSGLSLCGIPGSIPPPTDIVYIIDNSASMAAWGFWADPATGDTSWFIPDCKGANIAGTMVAFRLRHFGGTTGVDSLQADSLFQMSGTTSPAVLSPKSCAESNDPYSMRAQAVRVALRYQATFDPGAMAGVVFFNKTVKQTFPMSLLDAAGLQTLSTGTGLYSSASGTLWAPPFDTALRWLGTTPTPGRSKAIILVSDGEPTDSARYSALLGQPGEPPIYAVYLGNSTDATPQLDYVTSVTGGQKFVVPPSQPDSLATVLQKILGTLIKPAKPDTLRVTNLTNGQTSVATTSMANGNAYQMRLDSLVALAVGSNSLKLSITENGRTVSAAWTVVVSDNGDADVGGLDTLMTERCDAPTSLVLKPDKSGLSYAIDSIDRNILATLEATPDMNQTLPLTLSTRVSLDRENLNLKVPATSAQDTTGTFGGSIPWSAPTPTGAMPGDLVARSGPGWDTAVVHFQMPRDVRDTVTAVLALRRAVAPSFSMTPSVEGPTGQVQVTVVDYNIGDPAIFVTVRHRLGDSLPVKLVRTGNGIYLGSFTFAQGPAKDPKDTILELGAIGAGPDSLGGGYLSLSAQTSVRPATFHLRFLDAAGAAHDSLGFDLPLNGKTSVTVQVWFGSSPCPSCGGLVAIGSSDSGLQILSSSGIETDSIRLSGGQISVLIRGTRLVRSGSLLFSVDSLGASATAHPIRVLPSAPTLAVIADSDADGRADRVVVRLRAPISADDRFVFQWPDTSGNLQSRTLAASAAVADSGGYRLTFALPDPFAFGATSCPVAGCQALGTLSTTWYGPEIRLPFSVRDGVDPIPTLCQYRFSASENTFDTLVVRFSEHLQARDTLPWVSVGRPGLDSLGVVVKPLFNAWLSVDGRTAIFLVDKTFPGKENDSLRITSSTAGGVLSDSSLNVPNRLAWWTPIVWGKPPPTLTLTVPHAVVRSGTTQAPPREDPISVMSRTTDSSSWTTVEGPVLSKHDQDTRIGGVVVRLNRIPETLGLYIYDNLGVMVLKKDLSDLANQAAQGNLLRTPRGDYQIWLGWNGKEISGKPVATGVYFVRVYGWIKEGSRLILLNQIKSTGFYRELPN